MNLTPSFQLPATIASFALSTRGLSFLFGKLCLIASVGLAYAIGDSFRLAHRNTPVPVQLERTANEVETDIHASLGSYSMITTRNIFGKKKGAQQTTTSVEPLKLRLVGTNVGPGTPFAIIENTTKGEQELFDQNQTVFGQAKLVEIKNDSVKLDRNGQFLTLKLEEGESKSSTSGDKPDPDASDFTVPEDELAAELANLPRLLSQARAVPYFRNGQSIGMRLFAIRKDSMYEKLGLQNGDIVKSVNENSLSDPSQALKLFEQLKSERSINVTLERNGADRVLRYSIR